jgi:ring-1,2-phenylacetyl-CoA epoxidase subunit PaaE
MSKYYNLAIKRIVKETKDAITIHFKMPLFKKVKYKSGQFLTLIIPIENTTYRRAYSICTTPSVDKTVAITVKRVEGGMVSNYLNDNAKEGQKIEVMEAMGAFILKENNSQERNMVLIGSGSGITPLMSMIKNVLHNEKSSRVTLIYGNRNESSIIFKAELDNLVSQYQNRFNIIHFLSKPFNTGHNLGNTGRITVQNLQENLQKITNFATAEYYLCGVDGMMEAALEGLNVINIPENNIFKESFTASENESTINQADISSQVVSVVLNGDEHSFNVKPDQTILDAGLDAGLDIPFSCQSGVCTACRCKVLSGETVMDSQDALSDSEIEEGYILACQAHPMSADVKLDVG